MPRNQPRLDLTPPNLSRQVAEFCAEFPQFDYESLLYTCKEVEVALKRILTSERPRQS